MDDIDLTLPKRAPSTLARFDDWDLGEPYAMYSLVEMSRSQMDQAMHAAASDFDEDYFKLATKWDFHGDTAKAIYDYHVDLSKDVTTQEELEFHPTYFAIIISKNWKEDGMLLVNLNREEDGTVDTLRLKAKYVGEALANFYVANMDWEEYDDRPFRPGTSSDDDAEDDSHGDDESDNDSDDENESSGESN